MPRGRSHRHHTVHHCSDEEVVVKKWEELTKEEKREKVLENTEKEIRSRISNESQRKQKKAKTIAFLVVIGAFLALIITCIILIATAA